MPEQHRACKPSPSRCDTKPSPRNPATDSPKCRATAPVPNLRPAATSRAYRHAPAKWTTLGGNNPAAPRRRQAQSPDPDPSTAHTKPATRPAHASLDHSTCAARAHSHRTRGHGQLAIDAFDVAFNRITRQEQTLGNLAICQPIGYKTQNLPFAIAKS